MVKHKSTSRDQASVPKRCRRTDGTWRGEDEEGEEEESVGSENEDRMTNGPFVEEDDAKCGIIERISLQNFMCHGRLDVKNLSRNTNIMIGQNGSGKTSILNALVIALGGKAAMTDRGIAIKSFIKDGHSSGQVSIQLRNQGPDAYQPDKYGQSIIVERRLHRSGRSDYRIKAKTGRVISETRAELSNILDYFNIEIDNPITILNQNTSRTFLASNSPTKLYQFFTKATQLQQIKNDYMDILEMKNITKENIVTRKLQLTDLLHEVKQWEEKVKSLATLDDLIRKRNGLFPLAAWAQVAELEKSHEAIMTRVNQEESKMQRCDENIEEQEDNFERARVQHVSIERQIQELQNRSESLCPLHDQANQTRNELKNDLRNLKRNAARTTRQLQIAENDMQAIQERIEEEARRDQEQCAAERKERQQQISTLHKQIEEVNDKQRKLEKEADEHLTGINETRTSLANVRLQETQLKSHMEELRKRRRTLVESRQNRLKLYGKYIPQVVTEIDNYHKQGKFHRKPKGPLGTYLKVHDPQVWSLAVEVCLGGLLYNFCCHDHHDFLILRDIMGRVIPAGTIQPQIISAPFEDDCYDIRPHQVRCEVYPAFLDVVSTDDPVIFNTLVDQRCVEQILMIENKMEAQQFLKYTPPLNCREGYTRQADNIFAGREQRFYSCQKNRKSRILQDSIEDEIRAVGDELTQGQKSLQALKHQLEELNKRQSINEACRADIHRQERDVTKHLSSLQLELTRLEEEESEANVTVMVELEQELRECKVQIQNLGGTKTQLDQQTMEFEEQLAKVNEEYAKIDDEMNNIAEQIHPIKEKLCLSSLNVEKARQHRQHYVDKKTEHTGKRDALKGEADAKERDVIEARNKAIEISPERITVHRTAQNIDSEINEISKRIEKEQRRRGDPAEIGRRYNEAKDNYRSKEKSVRNMEKFIQEMDSMMELRQELFIQFRQKIAVRTKMEFITRMSVRNYNAQIHFDHQNEELNIKIDVNPDRRGKSQVTDIHQLSGGEKSFSTVCLLMALWDSVESPFRAMDEFDIFMDMVTRRSALENLMHYAAKNHRNQFLFLTPLDMSSVRPSPLLQIHRLQGPVRGANAGERSEVDEMAVR